MSAESALAKLYRQEAGSDFVDRVVSEPDSQHLISRFTIGEIDQQAVLIARRRLEADLARRRLLVAAVNDEHFSRRQTIARQAWLCRSAPDARCATTLGRSRAAASRACHSVR